MASEIPAARTSVCDPLGVTESHPARLLISCPDQTGIVAAVTGFLHARGANIVTLDQYSTDARAAGSSCG